MFYPNNLFFDTSDRKFLTFPSKYVYYATLMKKIYHKQWKHFFPPKFCFELVLFVISLQNPTLCTYRPSGFWCGSNQELFKFLLHISITWNTNRVNLYSGSKETLEMLVILHYFFVRMKYAEIHVGYFLKLILPFNKTHFNDLLYSTFLQFYIFYLIMSYILITL